MEAPFSPSWTEPVHKGIAPDWGLGRWVATCKLRELGRLLKTRNLKLNSPLPTLPSPLGLSHSIRCRVVCLQGFPNFEESLCLHDDAQPNELLHFTRVKRAPKSARVYQLYHPNHPPRCELSTFPKCHNDSPVVWQDGVTNHHVVAESRTS